MTEELRPSSTETISPVGLSWERTSFYHWYLRRNGTRVGSVYWNKTGYSIIIHLLHADDTRYDTQTDNTRYDTLDEAKAVAIALIAMRSK